MRSVYDRSQLPGLLKLFLTLSMAVVLSIGIKQECLAQGNNAGEFEGAVWKFKMTSKSQRNKELTGLFRVSNAKLYQKTTPEDPDFSKAIGINYPKKRKTRMVFTDLRAKGKKGIFTNGIKASVFLNFDRKGHWHGTLIDSKGKHWNFKCTRIQE